MDHYDFIVVGAGMMGSAAARHLAATGASVALVGPAEPQDKTTHDGVFASHYDQARITRRLDKNQDWSRLASTSIARYRQLEKQTGIAFFHDVGSIMAGPEHGEKSGFIQNTQHVAADSDIQHDALRGQELSNRFPYFKFPNGILALHETNTGGWINPRQHVAAAISAAQSLGAHVVPQQVRTIRDEGRLTVITCQKGLELRGGQCVVACGAFSNTSNFGIPPVPLRVYARTIAFIEIDAEETATLAQMPSVVYANPNSRCDPYILPPVRYPDGKTYIKIGGDPDDIELNTAEDLKAWFQSDGDTAVADLLAEELFKLMPSLRYQSIRSGSCVTSFSRSGHPIVQRQTDRLTMLTAGNGAGAKCADEVGRLGALVAQGEPLANEGYLTDFAL